MLNIDSSVIRGFSISSFRPSALILSLFLYQSDFVSVQICYNANQLSTNVTRNHALARIKCTLNSYIKFFSL